MKKPTSTTKHVQTQKGKYTHRLSNTPASGKHQSFRENDNFYRSLIESLEDYAVFTTDNNGIISSWNTGAQRLLRYKEEEIIGKHLAILFTKEDRKNKAVLKELQNAVKQGNALDERWHVRKDGSKFWASGLVFPLIDPSGKMRGYTKVMRDLTAHKQIEVERKRLSQILVNAPAFVSIMRGKNHVTEFANDAYYQIVGYRDIINKPLAEALPEVIDQGFIKILNKVYKNDEPFYGNEIPIHLQRTKDAPRELRYVNFVYQPIKSSDGSVSGIFLHGVDITEQVITRKKFEENQRRFAFLAEASKILSSTLDYQNILKNIARISVPHLADFCVFDILTEDNTIQRVTWEHVDKKKKRYVQIVEKFTPKADFVNNPVAYSLKMGKSNLIETFDESWMKKAATSKEHYTFMKKLGYTSVITVPLRIRNNVSGNLAFIFTKHSHRHFTKDDLFVAEELASRASLAIENSRMYQQSQKEISERKEMEGNLRESEERLLLALQAGLIGVWDWDIAQNKLTWSPRIYEIHGVDPKTFTVNFTNFSKLVHPEDRDYAKKAINKTLKGAAPFNATFRIMTPKGEIKWITTNAMVTRKANGKPARMIGATSDITEQKRIEQDKNDFVSIATHELKTPVTSLKAYAEALQRKFTRSGDELSATQLGKMNAQLDKLTSLISDLLDATKIESGKMYMHIEKFSFDELVREIVEELQRTTEKHALIIRGKTEIKVTADRERTGQVLTNLISNAIKYSPHTDKINIKVKKEANLVQVCVQDFGVGIPEEKKEKLFERFYRVSGPRENTFPGLGLGLFISSEIIKRQQGKIWVNSIKGKGSTFCFALPLKVTKKTKNT